MMPLNGAEALDRVQTFLLSRGWRVRREGTRFNDYEPPGELGLPQEFEITIPRESEAPDLPQYLTRLVETIADIYSLSADQIAPILSSAATVLSMSIEQPSQHSVSFAKFETMLEKLRKILLHTATFVSEKDPLIEHIPPEAHLYLDSCRFLHTTRGSFVANVQLPSGEIAPVRPLLEMPPLQAAVVNDAIADTLNFVIGPVLRGDENVFSDEYVASNLDRINVNVLEDVKGLFTAATDSSLAFSFIGVEQTREVSSGPIDSAKMYLLGEYVSFVKKRVTETFPINVEGRVVELRSRNPQRNRNYVIVLGLLDGVPTPVALTLKNELYQVAIQAHRTSRPVRIRGRARRMKTQVKVVRLEMLAIVPPPSSA